MALSLFQSTLGTIAALPPSAFTLNEQGVRQRMRETAAFCEIVRPSVAPPFEACAATGMRSVPAVPSTRYLQQ
jgi:hypothetical protein